MKNKIERVRKTEEEFVISSEADVKQGDALSPTLFCITLNRALTKVNLERFGERYENTSIPYLGTKMLEELTYQTSQLGQIVSTMLKDYNNNELRERIKKAYKAYFTIRRFFRDKTIDIKYKEKLYLSHIRPILIYGCQS
uniref:Reverse transcriptase domain-containing protein n=1 Tax=Strongyloides venezuelensis TaxID=75913 RepID=A0A0K0G6B2_STRVS